LRKVATLAKIGLIPQEEAMINVTQEALARFRTLTDQQEDKSLVLRLYARNADGALRYGMSWGEADESDVVVESEGVALHLEEFSVSFLAGAQVGYIQDELRHGFSIRGPGMGGGGCACGRGSCGCGGR
jgi:iron-sulfur cluster assembly accessory protein